MEAHKMWDYIEDDIENLDKNSRWHIVWHIDPYDDSKIDEQKMWKIHNH